MRRNEIDFIAGVVPRHVLHRAAAVDLTYECFLRRHAACRFKIVFLGISLDLHYFGMRGSKQLANLGFDFMIIKLAEDFHHNIAVLIDDITIWPTVSRVGLPGRA